MRMRWAVYVLRLYCMFVWQKKSRIISLCCLMLPNRFFTPPFLRSIHLYLRRVPLWIRCSFVPSSQGRSDTEEDVSQPFRGGTWLEQWHLTHQEWQDWSIYQDVSCQASIERVRDIVRWGAWLGRHICWIIMVYVVIMAWHGTTHGTWHMSLLFAALLAIATTTTWYEGKSRLQLKDGRWDHNAASPSWLLSSEVRNPSPWQPWPWLACFFVSHFLSLACTPDQPGL